MLTQRIVAVHQPNYIPWLGYFLKMAAADCFVFHDQARLNVRGYTRRTRIHATLMPDHRRWLTVPLQHFHDGTPIKDVRIAHDQPWARKHLAVIANTYNKAHYFQELMPFLQTTYSEVDRFSFLAELNVHIIDAFCQQFDIHLPIRLSSAENVSGPPSDVNALLVKRSGGTHYLSGKGAEAYDRPEVYHNMGICRLQSDAFHFLSERLPEETETQRIGLSVIDLWMRYGADWVKQLILDWRTHVRENLS